MSATGRWLERALAERSTRLIQPIPCAVLVDSKGGFGLFRRIEATRSDLSRHVTLIVGGHMDQPNREMPFDALIAETLRRELREEVGLTQVEGPEMIGLVTDRTTAAGARHVGIVHRVRVPVGRLKARADEEFALRSKYSGAFFDAPSLARIYPEFDAWSALVFEHVINPRFRDAGHLRRQLALPLAVESNGGSEVLRADAVNARPRPGGRSSRRRKGAA
jgi:predicted NUDIX family phosphoesterase